MILFENLESIKPFLKYKLQTKILINQFFVLTNPIPFLGIKLLLMFTKFYPSFASLIYLFKDIIIVEEFKQGTDIFDYTD